MIPHQHKGIHQPAGFCACLLQRIDKRLVIFIIEVNGISPIAPAHHTCPAVALAKEDGRSHRRTLF